MAAFITKEQIQELRDKTGVSVMACKRALEKAEGDVNRAMEFLKEEGVLLASKKAERETKMGTIVSYVHGGRIGALVEIKCETDFVARNPDFQNFARELAMQVAASSPEDLKGLLEGPYIKNPGQSVGDIVKEAIQKFGENIEVSRFSRLEL
ncbi:MAG: translation elongation factor Ts [Patescibacteria group bacterium]